MVIFPLTVRGIPINIKHNYMHVVCKRYMYTYMCRDPSKQASLVMYMYCTCTGMVRDIHVLYMYMHGKGHTCTVHVHAW